MLRAVKKIHVTYKYKQQPQQNTEYGITGNTAGFGRLCSILAGKKMVKASVICLLYIKSFMGFCYSSSHWYAPMPEVDIYAQN